MKISIVGLTNVGKSTLFNKLCGRNLSMSFSDPDTTVDYISFTLNNNILVDTCGIYSVNDFDDISGKYILESDLILYVIDGRTKPTNIDIEICRYLNKKCKKIWLICNKAENNYISENETKTIFYEKIFYTSAEHSLGIESLKESLDIIEEDEIEQPPLIAIVGRANSGKSTLMNCLLNYNRMKVEDKIGTTRDNVIEAAETIHYKFRFMDTPGYRRKEESALGYITMKRRDHCLKNIDGAILLLDGEIGLTKTDKQILNEIREYAKFVILCINKIDILNTNPRLDFGYFNVPEWFPVVKICAKDNKLGQLKKVIDICYSNCELKLSTNELNKVFKSCMFQLRDVYNNQMNIKYVFQKSSNPIVISYFANSEICNNSISFLSKKIAKYFNLIGVNIFFEKMSNNKREFHIKHNFVK